MLVGYVSNERYVALADMLFEFRRAGRVATARSTISGAVYADIEPGEYESRFDRRVESEANLLGVVFSYSGIMTAAPYRVLDDTHWCFAGTGLKNGDVFGEKSLHQRIPGGASGHETDKISPQSPANTRLLAKGLNPDEGGAEIVEHATASGGAVFSVGSICWPASILVDEAVSKITENAIRRYLAG